MTNRFDEVALPLLTAGLMTSRGLALTLRRHIPMHIKRITLNAMMREDEKRFEKGKLLVDKDELMAIAQRKEGFLLEFEAEMRAAGQVFDPRPVSNDLVFQAAGPPRPHRAAGDRPNRPLLIGRDRPAPRGEDAPPIDNHECHLCKKTGHIARNCTTAAGTSAPNGGSNPKSAPTRLDTMAAHKTTGHICEFCKKPGHTEVQCWSAHPKLVPDVRALKGNSGLA